MFPLNVARPLEEFDIFRVGTGPTAFNERHAEFVQFASNANLINPRKGQAFPLGAIAQGGVIDLNHNAAHFNSVSAFVFRNLLLESQDIPEFVHAIEQAGLGKRVNRERDGLPAGQCYGLGSQIHADFGTRGFLHQVEQSAVRLGIHDDRQQAILERIAAKDVGKGSGDDGPEAEASQRPGGVLAARPAAEVISSQENLGTLISGIIQHKIRFGRTVGVVAPVGKKIVAHAFLIGRFQETRRDDLVGVNIVDRQRNNTGCESGELCHIWISDF